MMKKILLIIQFILFLPLHFLFGAQQIQPKLYFCTASDTKYFTKLMGLIGSIHKVNFDDLGEIAVFDLGLTKDELAQLKKIEKISIQKVELTHPDLLKKFEIRKDKWVPGYYAWKPVVIKQALDKFPYILYIDAGSLVLKPLNNLFKHVQQNGCFFVTCGHNIRWMTTQYVIQKFDLKSPNNQWVLGDSVCGMTAGLQGLSKSIYNNYVVPMYELSKDLRNFIDDGTTPNGYGTGRHDQTLFSVLARILNLTINPWQSNLLVDGKEIKFCVFYGKKLEDMDPDILVQTNSLAYTRFIHFKKTKN